MRKDKKLLEVAKLLRFRGKAISRFEHSYVCLLQEYNNICRYDELIIKVLEGKKRVRA